MLPAFTLLIVLSLIPAFTVMFMYCVRRSYRNTLHQKVIHVMYEFVWFSWSTCIRSTYGKVHTRQMSTVKYCMYGCIPCHLVVYGQAWDTIFMKSQLLTMYALTQCMLCVQLRGVHIHCTHFLTRFFPYKYTFELIFIRIRVFIMFFGVSPLRIMHYGHGKV